MVTVADRLNAAVAYSRVGKWFQLEVRLTDVEVVRGVRKLDRALARRESGCIRDSQCVALTVSVRPVS
jgi:hypothetical protein